MERLRHRVSATVDGDAEAAAVAQRTSLRRGNSITASVVVPPKQLSVSLPIFSSSNGSAAAIPPYQPHDINLNGTSVAASLLQGSSSPPSSLSYTSLKDLLPQLSPAAINSPTAASSASGRSGYEISIRNRLVKQAAWAYLQPMSGSPGSSGPSFLLRLWLRLWSPVNACLGFVSHHLIPAVARALCRILQTLLRRSTV